MPLIDAERFKQTIETANDLSTPEKVRDYFQIHALKALLGGNYDAVVQLAIDAIPQAPTASAQPKFFDRNLGDYSGFSKAKMMERFGLTNEQADTVIDALGVTGA